MKDTFLGFTVHCHHKGGNSQAEMRNADQVEAQRNQLMQQQLQLQQRQLAMVNPSLQAILQNGGMLPAQEAAMRSAAFNEIGAGENQAIGAINQSLVARGITGGGMAGSGDIARNFGALQQGLLGQEAGALQNIQLAKGQNLMNAIGIGLGEGSMFGQQAMGFGGQGIGALNAGVNAANNADQASTGFWGSMIGGLAGLGGAAITKCFVAAELYGGWYTPEATHIREWLSSTWWMKPFDWFYGEYGYQWSVAIRKHKALRWMTAKLFAWFLRQANG